MVVSVSKSNNGKLCFLENKRDILDELGVSTWTCQKHKGKCQIQAFRKFIHFKINIEVQSISIFDGCIELVKRVHTSISAIYYYSLFKAHPQDRMIIQAKTLPMSMPRKSIAFLKKNGTKQLSIKPHIESLPSCFRKLKVE
jgi:hypothetical protein